MPARGGSVNGRSPVNAPFSARGCTVQILNRKLEIALSETESLRYDDQERPSLLSSHPHGQ